MQRRDRVDMLGARDELGGDGDTACRFDLVACEHPDLDAGVAEELKRWFHIPLQLVFDAGDAQELEIVFQVVADHGGDVGIAVLE